MIYLCKKHVKSVKKNLPSHMEWENSNGWTESIVQEIVITQANTDIKLQSKLNKKSAYHLKTKTTLPGKLSQHTGLFITGLNKIMDNLANVSFVGEASLVNGLWLMVRHMKGKGEILLDFASDVIEDTILAKNTRESQNVLIVVRG